MERSKKTSELEEVLSKTRKVDSELDNEIKKLNNYHEIKDNIDSLTQKLNNCYELFRTSMKGPLVEEELEDMENANVTFHKNARNYIESTILDTNKKIDEYTAEKEKLQSKAKELSEKENNSKE